MELEKARAIAKGLQYDLEWGCERITIAGSIRRCKPEVGDIELLCIPKYGGVAGEVNQLDQAIVDLILNSDLDYRVDKRGRRTYGEKNKFMVHRPSGIGVDIFCADKDNWGMSLVVRTGPASFCVRLMAHYKSIGCSGHAYGGVTDRNGQEIACPTEEDVFRLAGWPYVPPEKRIG